MLLRTYYNESGDTWVCVVDDTRAFVARRDPLVMLKPKWKLSYRRWVSIDPPDEHGEKAQELKIKELGEFDTIEQATASVQLSVSTAQKTYHYNKSHHSSSKSSPKTSDIFDFKTLEESGVISKVDFDSMVLPESVSSDSSSPDSSSLNS